MSCCWDCGGEEGRRGGGEEGRRGGGLLLGLVVTNGKERIKNKREGMGWEGEYKDEWHVVFTFLGSKAKSRPDDEEPEDCRILAIFDPYPETSPEISPLFDFFHTQHSTQIPPALQHS
jgi:hypothetical protein